MKKDEIDAKWQKISEFKDKRGYKALRVSAKCIPELYIAVDKDGNYITGGFFIGTLFSNTTGVTPITSAGESDFFVAKLGAYACGTNSTEKFNNLKVNVYPNPTTDKITIETDETLLNYIVYDMNGREIQNGMFGSSNQLNLQNAANGVYFVKITTIHNNVATVKVIKK